jgi:hypothetical protein
VEGSYFRCLCSVVLKVSGIPVAAPASSPEPQTASPATASPEPKPAATPQEENPILSKIIFPNLTKLIDLSRFSAVEERLLDDEQPPDFDDELPSLDDLPDFEEEDDLIPGSENIEDSLPIMGDSDEPEELTDEQKESFEAINVEDEKQLDPRARVALEELAKSEDPQFIIDMLYYLLEVKNVEIQPTVEKFVGNDNPLADYFARRILRDCSILAEADHARKEVVEPYPRELLFPSLFNASDDEKMRAINRSVEQRETGAVPYFVCQLLREPNAKVKIAILSKLGLIANKEEIDFFSMFLDEPGQPVRLAAIEGLGCIGGHEVIQHLVKAMVDPDPKIVAVTREALKSTDKEEVAAEILRYLIEHDIQDKQSFLTILLDFKNNVNAFRGVVWMFEDSAMQSRSFEAAKEFELDNEHKSEVIEEFLLLSFEDTPFYNQVADYLEEIHASYNRNKLVPVNVFDESYASQVRLSPLFSRDFQEKDQEEAVEEETAPVELIPFKPMDAFKESISLWKADLQKLKDASAFQQMIKQSPGQLLLIVTCFLLPLLGILKAFGKSNPRALSFAFLPSKFSLDSALSMLYQPDLVHAVTSTAVLGGMAMVPAWILASLISTAQLRRYNTSPALLACSGLFLPPMLTSALLNFIHGLSWLPIPDIALPGLALLLPFTSIFYLIQVRLFAHVPQESRESAMLLGAGDDGAVTATYTPALALSTFLGVLLCSGYLFAAHGIGYLTDTGLFIGESVIKTSVYPQGWLMLCGYGLPVILLAIPGLILFQSILPLQELIPEMGTGPLRSVRTHLSPIYAVLGYALFSKTKKAKKSKKNKAEVEAEPDQVEKADDSKDNEE